MTTEPMRPKPMAALVPMPMPKYAALESVMMPIVPRMMR